MVEHLTCNEDVAGSTPVSGSRKRIYHSGGVPEWSKGTDCKSVGDAFGGSNPPPTTSLISESFVGDFGLYIGIDNNYMASCMTLTAFFEGTYD